MNAAELLKMAVVVMGDDLAEEWMHKPQVGLGGRIPIELLAEGEVAAKAVEDLLGRIEYGIYT